MILADSSESQTSLTPKTSLPCVCGAEVQPEGLDGKLRDARAVCRSTVIQKLKEDGDYALYTVTLFRRVVDAFKSAAREKSFQVRDFTYDAEAIQAKTSERNDLKTEVEERRAAMYEWCQTCYGEVFSAWVHICAIRLFVESILRYGLPPSFLAGVMKPHAKCEKKLRAVLTNTFGRALPRTGTPILMKIRYSAKTRILTLRSRSTCDPRRIRTLAKLE